MYFYYTFIIYIYKYTYIHIYYKKLNFVTSSSIRNYFGNTDYVLLGCHIIAYIVE